MARINRLALCVTALMPTHPLLDSAQRLGFWILLLLPIVSLLCLGSIAFINGQDFMSTVYSYSVFQLFSPVNIKRFLSTPGTFIDPDEVDVTPTTLLSGIFVFGSTSAFALSTSVGTILRPPVRFYFWDKYDHRGKREVQSLYLFYVYTVPLFLYSMVEYIAMDIDTLRILNRWTVERQGQAQVDAPMSGQFDGSKELMLDIGVCALIIFSFVPVWVNLWFLVSRITDALEFLKEITCPFGPFVSSNQPFHHDCSDMEDGAAGYSLAVWGRALRHDSRQYNLSPVLYRPETTINNGSQNNRRRIRCADEQEQVLPELQQYSVTADYLALWEHEQEDGACPTSCPSSSYPLGSFGGG